MQFLAKTMKNARKHRDIKLVTTKQRKNYFVSHNKDLFRIFIRHRNEKNTETHE